MENRFEHLILPMLPEDNLKKKRRGGGGYKQTERDKKEFYKTETQKLDALSQKYKSEKRVLQDYFDPSLIYKLEVNQNVDENDLRAKLRSMNIEVISPSPDKKGYWVVFTEDEEFETFKKKLEDYSTGVREYHFFNAIDGISDISPEEKIGECLRRHPLREDEISPLDISIWRMDDERIEKFLNSFKQYLFSRGGRVLDQFKTQSFCRLKVSVHKSLLEELLVIREVESVDRPPKFKLETHLDMDIKDFSIDGSPHEDAPGILIVDSGILPNHPLLRGAVGDAIAIASRSHNSVNGDDPYDDVGHGTKVAGIALHGDIDQCLECQTFKSELWIFSSKVMYKDEYGEATYDEEELIEHQLDSAVRRIVENYPNCKVINLSLGNSAYRMSPGRRQFDIASLIDDLSYELDLIFVVSAGNFHDHDLYNNYPDYLLDDTSDEVKIVDTAASVNAITVGALYRENVGNCFFEQDALFPSPLTRVGPGYRGMIKPEFVEIGGFAGDNSKLITTINPQWLEEHRLFSLDCGTSFSAPKVSHVAAKLILKYPNYSMNLIKALLLSSASIPAERPGQLAEFSLSGTNKNLQNLMKVYGYGKPSLERAQFSERNRVIFLRQNTIKLDHVHIYPFYLPESFLTTKGSRLLSVSLSFNSPINKNRVEYLGVNVELHLFKNVDPEIVSEAYSHREVKKSDEEVVPRQLKRHEIKLKPGVNIRKKGTHQKAFIEYVSKPQIDFNSPLSLVVICQNRWIRNEDMEIDFGLVVAVEHSQSIDLYNQAKIRNATRIEVPIKG